MSLQLRRGPLADLELITPLEGEPIWTTDTRALYVGDGVTPGGIAVAGVSEIIAGDNISVNTSTGAVTITGQAGGVTEIIAGSNISITTSTGAVTISSTGGGESTSTYTNLTVLDDLFFGEGAELSIISREGSALKFQSANGQFAFESLDAQGVNVVSSNQVTAAQFMPLVNGNTGTIQFFGELEFTTPDLGIRFADNTVQTTAFTGSASTGTYTNLTVLDDLFLSSDINLSRISVEDGALRFKSANGEFSFDNLSEGGVAVKIPSLSVATISSLAGGGTPIQAYNVLQFVYDSMGIQFGDNTFQKTSGGTTVYTRDALPAGVQGRIITISDSGTDDNSPAGNWAPAYWDDDADEWTYIGNSNSVTIIEV